MTDKGFAESDMLVDTTSGEGFVTEFKQVDEDATGGDVEVAQRPVRLCGRRSRSDRRWCGLRARQRPGESGC